MEFSLCCSTVLRFALENSLPTYQGSHLLIENCLFSPRSYQIPVTPQLAAGFRSHFPTSRVRFCLAQAYTDPVRAVAVAVAVAVSSSVQLRCCVQNKKTKHDKHSSLDATYLPLLTASLSLPSQDSEGLRKGCDMHVSFRPGIPLSLRDERCPNLES